MLAEAALVRPARRSDVADLAHVEAASWQAAYQDLLPATTLARLATVRLEARWRRRITAGDDVLVYPGRDDRPLGYATIGAAREDTAGFAGEVYELYVHPEAQGAGVGRALLQTARAELGHDYAWLHVEVLRDNRRARAFYEAAGLETDGQPLRRPLGAFAQAGRYARTLSAVWVVRYEAALRPIAW
jgi:ribosomal protein S18 acetylase RimI-like enzyme